MNYKGGNEFIFRLQLKQTGFPVLTQHLKEHLPESLGLDRDGRTCADCPTGRRIKSFPFQCLPSNLVHEGDQKSGITYGPFCHLTTVPLGLTLLTTPKKTQFKSIGSGMKINPEIYRKHLIQPQGSCGRRRRTSQHIPTSVQGTFSLGTGSACRDFPAQGGPY